MTEPVEKNPTGMPPVDLPASLEPIYCNITRLSHTPTEIILDFCRFLPAETHLKVLSRVVMSPMTAKLLMRALADNLVKYEAAFGEIKFPGDSRLADDLFKGIHPPTPPETK